MEELYYLRAFLNRERHHATAHVIGRVRVGDGQVDAGLTIADCTRSITLDLDLYDTSTRADRRNGLYKVNLLRQSVAEFAAAVEQAYATQADQVRKRR